MQLSDLREDMVRCRYSGDMDTYVREVQPRNAETSEEVLATWEKFKAAGATNGYAASFATDDATCESIFKPPGERMDQERHLFEHPSFASSFVMQFPDQATAEAAYNAGLFGQSEMRAQAGKVGEAEAEIVVGEATGLGPNSVASNKLFRSNPVREAVWQTGAFNLYVATDVIERAESERITAAMNARIG